MRLIRANECHMSGIDRAFGFTSGDSAIGDYMLFIEIFTNAPMHVMRASMTDTANPTTAGEGPRE